MSTNPQLRRIHRRIVCTGESVNTVHRLKLSPTEPLIPAATGVDQCFLEAWLLRSWVTATDHEFGMRDTIMPSFVTAVHPFSDHLAISVLDPVLLLPLLNTVLPRSINKEQLGVPGLRVCWGRNYLELRLVGAGNEARGRVRFWNIDRQRAKLLVRLARLRPAFPPKHSERWKLWVEMASSSTQSDLLMSALLRRFPLWRTADRISMSFGARAMSVWWQGGPEGSDIGAVLSESSCRIPQARIFTSTVGGVHDLHIAGEHEGRDDLVEPWEAWNALHAAQTAACNRVAAAPGSSTIVVPEIWDEPEIRHALASRDVSAVYKLLRRRGLSQWQIAAMTGQSQSEVSEILKGRQVMAYDVLVRIADGLGVPRGYLGLAYDEVTVGR